MEITDIKYRLLSKHLFQRRGCTKPLGNDKFVSKIIFPSYNMDQKHSSKQVVSTVHTLGKDFFAAATFKGLWDVSFQTE